MVSWVWVPSKWVKSNRWRRKKEKRYVLTMASYAHEHHHHHVWRTQAAWINLVIKSG